ncbi:MAG: heparan-alpha-glucosaminide N-acetyltransferase domain-containing protein [Bacteroidales bacterium]
MSVQRRVEIDWLRGLAIVIMIEAHVFEAWTRVEVRGTGFFRCAMILAGFAAPAFLFLAGAANVLATRARRGGSSDDAVAARAVRRRGWQILGLAFLFRAQALFSLDARAFLPELLKVDILNIMGPTIVMSAVVLGAVRDWRRRLAVFAGGAAAFTFLAPIISVAPWLSRLPDPIEAYLRPQPGVSTFALFPWAGFLLAGSAVGVLIDRDRAKDADRVFHLALVAAGAAIAAAGCAASYLPPIYGHSRFWTTSPTFFFLRIGVLVMAVGLARFWCLRQRLSPIGRFGALERFGRSSLFVYWIHVDLVYVWLAARLHNALTLSQVAAAFMLVTALMFGLVLLKNRLTGPRLRPRRAETVAPTAA